MAAGAVKLAVGMANTLIKLDELMVAEQPAADVPVSETE